MAEMELDDYLQPVVSAARIRLVVVRGGPLLSGGETALTSPPRVVPLPITRLAS
jgi:hypothetical protein